MKRLTVLSVAYPLAPVGPDSVGGAEQILSRIDQALVAAGHKSLVVACVGSHTFGELISTGATGDSLTDDVQQRAQARALDAIQRLLRECPVDLIHMHGVDFHRYIPKTELPVVATLHLPPSWYPQEIFQPNSNLLLHCVSAAQRRACPANAKLLPDIPNGVPIPTGPLEEKDHFALSMGRICPEKGFHLAAAAARVAGIPFVLAGEVFGYKAHQEYFDRELQPLVRGEDARFIGRVGGEEKRRLLARAKYLLVPSLVPETSCLVALEAMAEGTPVIAFPVGALAELIQDEKNGFLVHDIAGMADAISRAEQISGIGCRHYVAENFSVYDMTARYLEMYSRIVQPKLRGYETEVQASEKGR